MQRLRNEAASIIAENVKRLDGIGTHSPYTMSNKWQSLFDNVKVGTATVDIGDVTSTRWNQADAFFGDDNSASQMLSSLLHDDKVELADVKFMRDKRFVMSSSGAYLVDDPHLVDYVLCHVRGYTKYRVGSKFFQYVKARDVIISGTLLSIKEIIDMIKSELDTLIRNEL